MKWHKKWYSQPKVTAGSKHLKNVQRGLIRSVQMFPDLIGDDQIKLQHRTPFIRKWARADIMLRQAELTITLKSELLTPLSRDFSNLQILRP